MTERCRKKRGVKISIVFGTVRFRIVLSVFGEKAESNFAFSAKARSKTVRFRQYTANSENKRNYAFSANMRSET